MIAKIIRFHSADDGVFGGLIYNSAIIAVTCELPWRDNQRKISCIPAGMYPCSKIFSRKFERNVWLVNGVPDRDAIEIHPGNTIKDIEGCILAGKMFGRLGNLQAVLSSHNQFDVLEHILPAHFDLEIVNAW